MKNEAKTILGLLSGTYTMSYIKVNDESLTEQPVRFSCYNYDLLEGYVTIQTKSVTYKNKKLKLPLDFEELDGMDALLKLIAAFAYPQEDVVFAIYKKRERACISRYEAVRLPQGGRQVNKIYEFQAPNKFNILKTE